jgi:hypothetical protein
MTIHELGNMESSGGNFGTRDLLANYTAACPDRLRSLHNYIVFSPYGQKIRPSVDFMRSFGELIAHVQKQFFPDKQGSPDA